MLDQKFFETELCLLLKNELETKFDLDSRVASQLALNFLDLFELSDGDLKLLQESILQWQ
jgi:hypothetical protein